jgi:WD40 repeat-containing protein SMU1
MTGKLRKDLSYQNEDNMMLMETGILTLAFSRDSTLLASGSQSGKIKIWNILTGKCTKKLSTAHSQGVTSVSFNEDASQVLSSSFDGTMRLFGLVSAKLLKEYRGHSSFVNTVCFSTDGTRIVSGSSDGSLKIWNTHTTECLFTLNLLEGEVVRSSVNLPTIHTVISVPGKADHVLVGNKSGFVYLIDIKKGQVY